MQIQDNPRPKVSVIIPVYNVERYFDRCVRSVLGQTLREIEVILVDDGSPDGCPAMCDAYAREDPRVRVVHKANAGLGMARNSGLDIATGEYVAFVDSDDFIDRRMYETLYRTAREHGLDTCYCGFNHYKNGVVTPKREVDVFQLFKGKDAVRGFLLDMVGPKPNCPHEVKYLMCVWKAIYSMPLIKRYGLRFDSEKVLASEDILFHSVYLPKAENVGFVPDCFYYYCVNGASISRTYSDEKFSRIKNSLVEVRRRLLAVCSEDVFMLHYQRYLFLSLRGVLWHEIFSTGNTFRVRLDRIRSRCTDDVYRPLFSDYPYCMLPLQKRVLYIVLRSGNPLLIMLFYYLLKISGK